MTGDAKFETTNPPCTCEGHSHRDDDERGTCYWNDPNPYNAKSVMGYCACRHQLRSESVSSA